VGRTAAAGRYADAYPFHAEGIVTNLFTDANGTQHINLHRIPDRSGLWRYLGITLLLLSMLGCMAYHGCRRCVVINAIASVWKRFRNITKAA
jgi:hypothetical protein